MNRMLSKLILFLSVVVLISSSLSQPVYGSGVSDANLNKGSKIRFSNIQLKTGVRLHYVEQGDPSGPVIVMLHGFGDSWFSYSRVLASMDRKYHIFVLDQRGHGNSDRPVSGYSLQHFAADVLAFMDAKGLKDATVVGHSMGSFVAQHVAAIAPERVKRLVLVGTATSVKNNAVPELGQMFDSLSDPVSEKFIREFQVGMLTQPVPTDFIEGIVSESRKIPARLWKVVMTSLLSNEDANLTKIKSPTLIVWGDAETTFLRAEQDALLSALSNSRLVVYEKVGHCPNWEMPERFVRDLQDFMND